MSDCITNDYQLYKEAESIAKDTFDRILSNNPDCDIDDLDGDMREDLWESVDSSQHVIYTYRAKLIADRCDCYNGEEYLAELYGKPFDGCETFDEVVTRLAFAELYIRSESALRDLIEQHKEKVE